MCSIFLWACAREQPILQYLSFLFLRVQNYIWRIRRKTIYMYGTPFTRRYTHTLTMWNRRLHGLHTRRREDLNLWFIIIENAVLWNGIDKNIFMISYYKYRIRICIKRGGLGANASCILSAQVATRERIYIYTQYNVWVRPEFLYILYDQT